MITIDGFEQLTQQQIFDMAVEHIGNTKQKSICGKGCVYSGSGCNAAPLLKPEYHRTADATGSWQDLVESKLVPKTNFLFIDELQSAHDDSYNDESFMRTWYYKMFNLAEIYKLDTTKINALPINKQ